MNKPLLLALTLFPLASTTVFAQGQFLPKGQNGIAVTAAVVGSDDATAVGATVGYSIKGMFDFGLGVSRIALDEGLEDANGDIADVNATAISPYVTFHVIKQDPEQFPVSVAIGANYEYGTVNSDALDDFDLTMTTGSWLFGGMIYSTVDVTPNFQIQPQGSFAYVLSGFEIEDDMGNSISDDESLTGFGFGLSLIFKTDKSTKFVVSPGLGVSDGDASFSIEAGFVFSTP